jgi:hypothetical protein
LHRIQIIEVLIVIDFYQKSGIGKISFSLGPHQGRTKVDDKTIAIPLSPDGEQNWKLPATAAAGTWSHRSALLKLQLSYSREPDDRLAIGFFKVCWAKKTPRS